jgi:hypothetical protein
MNAEYAGRARIEGMPLTIWRRHTHTCPQRAKGRAYLKCNCPLWADGYVNGRRTLRQSLETRDLPRARKKAIALESPDDRIIKPVADAVKAFRGPQGRDDHQVQKPADQVDRLLHARADRQRR